MEYLASLFTSSSAGGAATSAATTAAENAALAQAGSSAASVTAAGQASVAAQTAASGVTAAQLATYIGQGATLLQGVAGYQSGSANAAYLRSASGAARAVGAANKNLMDARGRASLGELKAQAGAQGTTLSGSPMLVYLDSVRNAAIESQNEYYSGAIKAQDLSQQAKFTKKGAQNDLWSGIIGASGPTVANLGSRLLG